MDDRHARSRATPSDPRHRPIDGFRASSAARFAELVKTALQGLSDKLTAALDGVELRIEEVPPPSAANAALLVRYETAPSSSGQPDRLRLFRRPLEARARSANDLTALIREATVLELATVLGIDRDRLDEPGWE